MGTATTAVPAAGAGTTTEISQAGRLGLHRAEAAGTYVGELFAGHGRMVLGLSRLLLRDPVEAEDAAQQVFVSAHQALLRGSMPRDEAAWLAAIARNECRSRIRARMREPLALPELPSDLPDPLAAAIRATDLRAVWTALGTLPRRQRNALVLRELGGGCRTTSSVVRSVSRSPPSSRCCFARASACGRSSRERTPRPCQSRCATS